jgi:hypothetical protein
MHEMMALLDQSINPAAFSTCFHILQLCSRTFHRQLDSSLHQPVLLDHDPGSIIHIRNASMSVQHQQDNPPSQEQQDFGEEVLFANDRLQRRRDLHDGHRGDQQQLRDDPAHRQMVAQFLRPNQIYRVQKEANQCGPRMVCL